MSFDSKELSNPFSTGGGGAHFESYVQAAFVILMLTGGYVPGMPCWPIKKIKLQGKIDGYDTDDLILTIENNENQEQRKLLGQIKHSISITKSSSVFAEVIQAAWNDFRNPKIFNRDKDIIALITGSLSTSDTKNVQWLLNQARHTHKSKEFIRHIEQSNFSSKKSREKLAAFKFHLKAANGNIDVSSIDLYDFLRHFYLFGFDLGQDSGTFLSLLFSHISQFNNEIPDWIWVKCVDFVQFRNQNAGTITIDCIPEDIKKALTKPVISKIPSELTKLQPTAFEIDWNQHQYATDLALVNLVGAWDENYIETDLKVLEKILGKDYKTWIHEAREILQLPGNPFSLNNRQWIINEQKKIWGSLCTRIFDQNLNDFHDIAVKVLTEINPSLELPANDRYMAILHGKKFSYSQTMRKSLAESLALLGNNSSMFINCSLGKVESTVAQIAREIFSKATWKIWGSLDTLLPDIAEANPMEFLSAIEDALQLVPCPIDELFLQETSGITGRNYLTGLLWALEALAWNEDNLVQVCMILGELASHDTGGSWGNRPENSLITIFLPWLPQTYASLRKRKAAIQTLCKELPDIGWKLVISLLPKQQVSTGSFKQRWSNTIPKEWKEGVSNHEYWDQISFFSEMAIDLADNDPTKLAELTDNFDKLPKPSFDKLIKVLSSKQIIDMPEEKRLIIWDHLQQFTHKHRRYADTTWALKNELLTSIETVQEQLAPLSEFYLFQYLFIEDDFELYNQNNNWNNQRLNLEKRREIAIKALFKTGGIELILHFADSVISPRKVGFSLGTIEDSSIDATLIPHYITIEKRKNQLLVTGYIRRRFQINGWNWVDGLNKDKWDNEQLANFLNLLPFNNETWVRVDKWLNVSQKFYWTITSANAYETNGNLDIAVNKLIEYKRPYAAIKCLYKMYMDKQPLNPDLCLQALLAGVSSKEPVSAMLDHEIVTIIKTLQNNSSVSLDDLSNVEWAYLPLFDAHGATPISLENQLANDPDFFCEVIRLLFHSKKEKLQQTEPKETSNSIAENALRLLYIWHTPPGTQIDGSFNEKKFISWFQRVKTLCIESGHLDIALYEIGKVLIHSPIDSNGLWINRTVAEELNSRDMEEMRKGFHIGFYNSRGVHSIDPSGKDEKELATQFRQKADKVENAGFQRLAISLRDLAKSYDLQAEHVINNYKKINKN